VFFGNTGNLAINNELYPRLGFDTLRDFTPVAQVNESPFVLTVATRLPVRTLDDLLAHARANPGRLSFASAGIGSAHHLALELFRRSLGLDIQHVPYRGMAPAIADFVAGNVDGFFDGLNGARPVTEAGLGRMLATTGAARAPWLPEVPTIAEAANLPGYEVQSWMALMVPAAMPPEARLRLQVECEQLLQPGTPLVRALDAQGFVGRFRDGAATRALIEAERARWGRIIREAGITPND
jgi:tripartite-type tricarboxylate transporter receptor subunit TctC